MTSQQKNWIVLIIFSLIGMVIGCFLLSARLADYAIYVLGFSIGYWFRGVENKE